MMAKLCLLMISAGSIYRENTYLRTGTRVMVALDRKLETVDYKSRFSELILTMGSFLLCSGCVEGWLRGEESAPG